MRCIEIADTLETSKDKGKINRNMRYIEILRLVDAETGYRD